MRIAVLGATGMLGSMLVDYLCNYYDLVVTSRNKSYKNKFVKVRYLDAETSTDNEIAQALDDCEWAINAIGAIPQRAQSSLKYTAINSMFPMRLSLNANCKIIQIATDCVYSGSQGLYSENDTPDPIDDYGLSKYAGEFSSKGMYHLRCSIIGKENYGNYSLLAWFLSQHRNAVIDGYVNHFWNGVTTLHFAKVCRGIINSDIEMPYIQHLVPADVHSKYGLLSSFAREFERDDITINAVDTPTYIDRTLSTVNKDINEQLWANAGYDIPPTIATMINELSLILIHKGD